MVKNLGNIDRTLRIIIALILFILGYNGYVTGMTLFVFYFIGIVLLLTGIFGWCGLYSILGISSKGQGLDKISKRDIESAIKKYKLELENQSTVQVKVETPKKKKAVSKKKKTTSAAKKTTTSKKKTASKKATAKKTTKKSPAKKTAKKAATKKKTASKKK